MTNEELFEYFATRFGLNDWQRSVLWIDTDSDIDGTVFCYLPRHLEEVFIRQEIEDDWDNNVVCAEFLNEYKFDDVYQTEGRLWVNPIYQDLLEKGQKEENKAKIAEEIVMRSCRLKTAAALSREEFSTKLTTLEKEAFTWLREKIADEGNISIVKAIQETNISRPIWTALLGKMKEYNFAEVENQGMKGTRIKFN